MFCLHDKNLFRKIFRLPENKDKYMKLTKQL